MPLSGEAAAFGAVGPGAKAYFDYVNSRGGVHGRRIEYRFYDDGYNPAQTVQQTRRLVEQDRVFAVFNAIGTANNLAIRDYLNAQKVPHLFAGDGSQALGGGSTRYPWTVGFLPSYQGEGSVLGRDLVRTKPRATVGVLYENTELGKDMTRGLSRALAGKGPRIVASEAYELTSTDVVSQISKLKSSGADTLMLFATPKFMIQAIVAAKKLGWKPQLYLASVSIEPTIMAIARANAPDLTRGARAIAFVKNPNDPVWTKDPAVTLYRSILKRFAPSCEADRRVPLVRHDGRLDDGRRPRAGGQEPHARERAARRAEPDHHAEPVPAPRHAAPHVGEGLLPARHGLPVPLRQPPVGSHGGALRDLITHDANEKGSGTHMRKRTRMAVLALAGSRHSRSRPSPARRTPRRSSR